MLYISEQCCTSKADLANDAVQDTQHNSGCPGSDSPADTSERG